MAENKTKPTDASVEEFLNAVPDERKRADSFRLVEIMREITGEEPVMWGDSIVGFGSYHYKYASGREGDQGLTGFSPRKASLTIYITPGFDRYGDLLGRLGKFTTSKVCLYVKRLSDVDEAVLRELIRDSVEVMRAS
ncbi:MAG: DUF1801 domain-containing protein [Candidatus Promineofilum sp.]|jgi:hypothetical protein|nr:DUF1801 domain-containing protein [Promineifilum sp.]